jgi:PAT family beta-lactamase induction signal transducer AmpG
MSTTARLGLLACLYFSQGVPYGFFAKGLPSLMREQGMSLEGIGLTSLLFLPWALKFLVGPVVDGFGRRTAWILPLQAASVILLAVMAGFSLTADLPTVMALVAVVCVVSALQDVATDGLAVDLLRAQEVGAGNAVQVGAYRIGMVLSGGVLLILYARLGWDGAFYVMAGLLLLASVPVALYREPARRHTISKEKVPFKAGLLAFLQRPGAGPWLLLLVLYKTFDALPGRMVGPMLTDQGHDIQAIGEVLGTVGSVAALLGAILAGVVLRRMSRGRALLVFGLLQALALALYLLPALKVGGMDALYMAVAADELFGTLATVALFSAMMDVCRPGWAATDYTVQASLVVVATGAAGALGGYVAVNAGYPGLFALTTGLTLAGWLGVRALLARGVLTRLGADGTNPA